MRSGLIARLALVFCAAISFFGLSLAAQESEKSSLAGKVIVVPVRSDSLEENKTLRDLQRLIEDAGTEEANAIVFEFNVRRAASADAQERWLDVLSDVPLPTVAFVNPSATGAGALLPLACDSIYLSRSGIIGGAIIADPKSEKEDEKSGASSPALSILKARARSLAKANGYRVEIAEAFIDGDVEVKIGERLISEKGDVLTLTAEEAAEKIEGQPLLAKGISESLEDILNQEGLGKDFQRISPGDYVEKKNREALSQKSGAKASDKEKAKSKGDGLFSRKDKGDYSDKIVVLKVGEDALASGKSRFEFMDRTLKKAELEGAKAVVFDMDTPGGYAWQTKGLVLNSLQGLSYPTYTFVNTRAESAGAIIAVGTDHIYMRPAASIGSALVIMGGGQDLPEAMEDKVTQMAIATVRNVAEIKGHNPDVAEAFVTRKKEVKIDGVVVHESGSVLNLNTIQATEKINGKPVLAKGVASDVDDLIAQENLKGEKVSAEPLGMESFAHWVQKFSFLFIMIGIAAAYAELNSPGFGVPGLVSVAAFGLFFFGNYVAGNLAGYELAVLLAIGLILIAVEVFVFPGAILPGAIGAVLVVVSLGLAMVDRVDFTWKWKGLPNSTGWVDLFGSSLLVLAIGLVGSLVLIFLLLRYLPETKAGSVLILNEEIAGGASLSGGSSGEEQIDYVGWKGKSSTDLRPAGKGDFPEKYLDVITDGEFVEKGKPIEVIKHEGSRIVVREVT